MPPKFNSKHNVGYKTRKNRKNKKHARTKKKGFTKPSNEHNNSTYWTMEEKEYYNMCKFFSNAVIEAKINLWKISMLRLCFNMVYSNGTLDNYPNIFVNTYCNTIVENLLYEVLKITHAEYEVTLYLQNGIFIEEEWRQRGLLHSESHPAVMKNILSNNGYPYIIPNVYKNYSHLFDDKHILVVDYYFSNHIVVRLNYNLALYQLEGKTLDFYANITNYNLPLKKCLKIDFYSDVDNKVIRYNDSDSEDDYLPFDNNGERVEDEYFPYHDDLDGAYFTKIKKYSYSFSSLKNTVRKFKKVRSNNYRYVKEETKSKLVYSKETFIHISEFFVY